MTDVAHETQEREGLKQEAGEKVQEAASVAQQKAGELREQGTARLSEQLDERTTQVGTQTRSVAKALRESSQGLREEGNEMPATITDQAGERIEQLGSYLERIDGDALLRDVEGFARRHPWTLAGVGLVAGLAAARFLKASSDRRYGGGGGGDRWTSPQGGRALPPVAGPMGGYDEAGAYASGRVGSSPARESLTRHPDATDDPLTRDLSPRTS